MTASKPFNALNPLGAIITAFFAATIQNHVKKLTWFLFGAEN
jgi:hypothetical protein